MSSGRGRNIASVVLAVLAAILVLVAAILFYARAEVISEEDFADRAAEALADEGVRTVVARELVVQIAERADDDLLAARPVLEAVVGEVIESAPFREIFREAALQMNRLLFVRDRASVAFNLGDAAEVVRFGLQSVSPDLAERVPEEVDVTLLALQKREFARQTLDFADQIRGVGLIAPILALLALLGSVLLSPDRRTGVLRAAVAVAAAGAVLTVAMLILRARLLAGVVGAEELSDVDVRAAVSGILDAFLGGLFNWGLLLAFGGAVVAGAAAVLRPEREAPRYAELGRRLARRPESTIGRVLRGVALIAAGLLVALEPELVLAIVGVLLGASLVFAGSGELLLMLQRDEAESPAVSGRRRRTLLTSGGVVAAVAGAVVVALLVLTEDEERANATRPTDGCNGSRSLCALRLNEAVFAGTHNSFSAADDPGWFIANQRHDIAQQLEDGIRLFLIDPHYGIETENGAVQTDFAAEQRDRNKVARELPPDTLAAAQRLAGGLGLGGQAVGTEPDVWLCHTVCELGATSMADALADVAAFLDQNPGEVVVVFIEPYVPPDEIAAEFEEAGLVDQLATLDRSAPLPTLGQLVASGRRLVVFTEKDADEGPDWYHDGFSFIQDTPLGETRPDDLSCDLERGEPGSPILMLNQWADVFPPQRGANPPFQARREILGRARECARERGLPVGFIAVDHYDLGELISSVARLNRNAVAAKREAVR